jgi:hypothetical protein
MTVDGRTEGGGTAELNPVEYRRFLLKTITIFGITVSGLPEQAED